MEFQTVNVSGLGPFAQEQFIHLSHQCNLIQGANGSGKTSITAELMRIFKSAYTHDTVPLDQALSLCFIGEDYAYLNRRESSVFAAAHRIALETNSSKFTDALTFHINCLIGEKRPRNKFTAAINAQGSIDVCDENGCGSPFSAPAASEQFVLSLATNLAVRDLLEFYEPIVIDGAFGSLDQPILSACFRSVVERSEQRIILQSPRLFNRVSAQTDFTIVVTAKGFSEIEVQRV
jgi:hypothetical protein